MENDLEIALVNDVEYVLSSLFEDEKELFKVYEDGHLIFESHSRELAEDTFCGLVDPC